MRAPGIPPGNAKNVPVPSETLKIPTRMAIKRACQGPRRTPARTFVMCCQGSNLVPPTGKLVKDRATVSAVRLAVNATLCVSVRALA